MSEYLKSCQSEFWKEVFRKEAEYISRELRGYKSVLSIGCGPAIIEGELQENGFNITGLDISKEALEEAPDSIRTIVGSAEDMEFEDASFNAAIYVASLQFVNDYGKAIQETARVLKSHGRLLVMLLNPTAEFFKVKRSQAESYINKIKHLDLAPIEEVMQGYFAVDKAEYYLGIKNEEVFESQNPNLAALYIITGVKK